MNNGGGSQAGSISVSIILLLHLHSHVPHTLQLLVLILLVTSDVTLPLMPSLSSFVILPFTCEYLSHTAFLKSVSSL